MRNLVSAWCGIFGLVLVAGCSDGDSSTGTGGSGGAGGSAGTTAGTAGVGAGGSGGTAGTSVGGSAGAAGSAGTGGSAVGGTGGTQVTQVARVEIYSEDFCNFCTEFSIGVQRKFAARAYDESDNEVTTTFAWSTSDASIAEVDQTGLVTGIAEGEVTLLASAEGVDGSSLLTITPEHVAWVEVSPNQSTLNSVGATQQFTAKAYGDLGNELSNVSFEWLTANALVANVDQSGVATAAGRGLTAIQVIANGWTTGHAMLTVIDPVPAGTPFALTSVTGGGHHGCGVNATNRAYCWGWNYYGQLGNGGVLPTTAHASTPQLVKGGHAFAQVTAGLYHTCAVDTAGKGFCWGFQEGGQLGNGKTTPDAVKEPAEILGNLTFERLSAGGSHTCGIDVNKKLYCWGSGIEGALGVGHDQNLSQPTPVAPSEDWMDVVTGLWSTCALRANGKAYCWGDDEMGQLGNGQPLTDSNVPQPVAGDLVFTSLDTYRATICGVTDAQEVWCWGVNDFDQIGEGQGQAVPEPVKLTGGGPAIAVAAGSFHTCIVEAGGAAQCRGESSYGQTGTGVIGQDPTWQPVVGNQHYASIEVGSHFSCGIVSGQGAYCWGDNGFGQLASGLTGGVEPSFSPTPWPMAAP